MQAVGVSAASAGVDPHDEEGGPWHLQEKHDPARKHPELKLVCFVSIFRLYAILVIKVCCEIGIRKNTNFANGP